MQLFTDPYETCWYNCLTQMQKQTPQEEFARWLQPVGIYDCDGDTLRLRIPSKEFITQIEHKYIKSLEPIIRKEFGTVKNLRYVVIKPTPDTATEEEDNNQPASFVYQNSPQNIKNPFVIPGVKRITIEPQLNFDYTFEHFVEGDCNKLARAVGLSIANEPGKAVFNPLFIYGNSGLGKTHLAQAIGIDVKKRHPEKNVLYVSANRFMDQFTAASKRKEVNDFIRFYQMIDLLIVDDVQELAGKPKTQIAFFNIFNHLRMTEKQLVFTSDKSPAELLDIEQRLISRFKSGLSVELTAPDFETKVKIIRSKCKRLNLTISDDIIEFLADSIKVNIREIEGAISSLTAYSDLLKCPISIDLAKKILKSYVKNEHQEVTTDLIEQKVCEYYNIKSEEFHSRKRTREIAQARQVAMYLCKEFTALSLKAIGAAFGGKSHATVVHACKAIANLIETDKEFAQQIATLRNKL